MRNVAAAMAELSPRDRKALSFLVLFLLGTFIWYAGWQPMADYSSTIREEYARAESSLKKIKRFEKAKLRLNPFPRLTPSDLVQVMSEDAQEAGLTIYLQDSSTDISGFTDPVDLSRFMSWLSGMLQMYPVTLQYMEVTRSGVAGKVNAIIILNGPIFEHAAP